VYSGAEKEEAEAQKAAKAAKAAKKQREQEMGVEPELLEDTVVHITFIQSPQCSH
jgi:hypothetical protein